MKHYKDQSSEIYAFAQDGSQDAFIPANLTLITNAEADLIRNPPPTLAQAKAAQIRLIEADYQSAIHADIVYLGATFNASEDSQLLITKVLSAGGVPAGFFWQDIANNQVAMTYVQLQGMAGVILARGQLAFITLQDLKVQVRLATTVLLVQSVIWL